MALRLIGAQIYASAHHASGKLMWLEPGKGYGFPVTNNFGFCLWGTTRHCSGFEASSPSKNSTRRGQKASTVSDGIIRDVVVP